MWSVIESVWAWLEIVESNGGQTILNAAILFVALIPCSLISYKILVEPQKGMRVIYRNKKAVNWLFFLCGVQILFYTMKVPMVYKIVVFILMLIPTMIIYKAVTGG
jgi:hypothetical protein